MMAEDGRVTILLVDDEWGILLLLERLLRDENFEILLAGSGREGLALLRAHPEVGVIVSDLMMPEMDGVRFLEQAKEIAPMAMRIILTGYADLANTIEAINRGGASIFLSKPWEEQQLRCTLREAGRTFLMRRENEALLATVHRQNEELFRWNQTLEELVEGQTRQIRRQAEQLQARSDSLQKLTDEFHAILNGIPDSLLHLSADFQIRWANIGATRRLGRSVEDLIGHRCFSVITGKDKPCPNCPAVQALASGRIEDALITDADGRTWGVKAFPLKDHHERCTGMIVWASDVTEKLLLRAAANHASRLAALGEMAAGVAHEINNPNAVLLFNLPTVQATFAEVRDHLDGIWRERGDFTLASIPYALMREELPVLLGDCLDSANRIGRIVEDIKDFIRFEEEGLANRVSLNEVAAAAMRLAGKALGHTPDWFRCDFDPALPPVRGSFGRLEQVVVNLLRNACQALVDGQGEVALVTRFSAEHRLCALEVHDTGGGIPTEILSRICEPFFTTRRERGGTGLGLSVSNRIAQEHGGRLEFTQRPGGGAIVALLLPPFPEELGDV